MPRDEGLCCKYRRSMCVLARSQTLRQHLQVTLEMCWGGSLRSSGAHWFWWSSPLLWTLFNHPYQKQFLLQGLLELGLHGKVLVAAGATGVAPVRNFQRLPLCLTEPVPASSKRDQPLAKAEPTSDGGSASGTTYLRRGKKTQTGQSQQESRV